MIKNIVCPIETPSCSKVKTYPQAVDNGAKNYIRKMVRKALESTRVMGCDINKERLIWYSQVQGW